MRVCVFAAFLTLVPAAAAADSASLAAPVVPSAVPFRLLIALEAAAAAIFVLAGALGQSRTSRALTLCARCARLHAVAEAVGRAADALAAGALAFLVALPFVAAGYESGFTMQTIALGASAVIAVLAVAAEAYVIARGAACRVLPGFSWSAPPTRIVGGGARWAGALFALYLFEPRSRGIATLFGGVGDRLMRDLSSTSTIAAAAAILAGSCFIALAARWLVPLVAGSQPATFAAFRAPHRTR